MYYDAEPSTISEDIAACLDFETRIDEGKFGNLLAALFLGSSLAMADPVDLVKGLEGSVKDSSGRHVAYDDATGKVISPKHRCSKCGKDVEVKADGTCAECGSKTVTRYPAIGTATIGYGTTKSSEVSKGAISEEEATRLLKEELERVKAKVKSLVKVSLNDNQLDALTSFAYNVGLGAFEGSTLLKKLNDGKYEEVPGEMRRWNKSGGQENEGLKSRREKEIELWGKQ